MSPVSDRDLIAAVLRGQVDAFATLVGRYRDAHTRFATRMVGGHAAADEALQASFVRAFQSLSRCDDAERFGSWLFRIVINECRAMAMRRSVRERVTGEMAAVAFKRAAAVPATVDAAAEIQRAVDKLDPINREAFLLQYVEELPYDEMAALTAASVGTLETRVDRACARLRELLERMYAEHRRSSGTKNGDAHDPGVSFFVRIAEPLRRPEVLNDTFEDRLMAKLLRPGNGAAHPESSGHAAPSPSEPVAPASSTSLHAKDTSAHWTRSLPPRLVAVAAGLLLAAFASGYGMRAARAPAKPPARTTPAKPAVATVSPTPRPPRVIVRTDTVKVVRHDTVHLVRFVYADPAAKSVALVGDFNDWNAKANPLVRQTPKSAWATTLPVEAGRHQYAFVVNGKKRPIDSLRVASEPVTAVAANAVARTTTRATTTAETTAKTTAKTTSKTTASSSKARQSKPTPTGTGTRSGSSTATAGKTVPKKAVAKSSGT